MRWQTRDIMESMLVVLDKNSALFVSDCNEREEYNKLIAVKFSLVFLHVKYSIYFSNWWTNLA